MTNLSIDEILNKIDSLEAFECISQGGGFKISIKSYVPYVCVSIHSGSNFKSSLDDKVNLTSFERWQEEDPSTDKFISELPITISALDSRYEYDLNREKEKCIYKEAWGKTVWREELKFSEIVMSFNKYDEFYRVYHHLIEKLESLFKSVFVFDIHSYNYKRKNNQRELPLFNIGTHFLQKKFRGEAEYLLDKFKAVNIDNIKNITAENDIFQGKGYLAEYTSLNFKNTGIFPIEVKKVYCDETSGIFYEEIVNSLKLIFNEIITDFADNYTANLSYNILNNFNFYKPHKDESQVADKIASLIRKNYAESNEGEYTDKEIELLISTRTKDVILKRLMESYTVYVCHKDRIIACGSLMKKNGRVEAKMLNVNRDYRGMGLAKHICSLREDFAKKSGYNKLYIESLKFENTVKFHTKRGFNEVESPRNLKYSVYMCKSL